MKRNPAACPAEPILYWITSLPEAITASELYRKRWKIEICFKCFKTNGFNLQQMKRCGVPVQKSSQDRFINGRSRFCLRAVFIGRFTTLYTDRH